MLYKKYPCWAVGMSKKSKDVIIYTFVTNKEESDRAKEDYRKILQDDLFFVLQKDEPFGGW